MAFRTYPRSLYIHIPFCVKKCRYCDFFSFFSSDDSIVSNILSETLNQIRIYKEQYCKSNFKTLYIGGGTPTSLRTAELGTFIEKVLEICDFIPEEFTIEINPETVDDDLISLLAEIPVTRMSIGIQSFSGRMLEIIGRNCSPQANFKALEMLKALDNKTLSLDLISSIPGQNVSEAIDDVKKALRFIPDHISLYYLTLEKKTPLFDNYSDTDQDENCWVEAADYLYDSGYNHYEISNFARTGKESLHNMNYWRMEPYMGCGMSAVSTVYDETKCGIRLTASSVPEIFLEGSDSQWGTKSEKLSRYDLLVETLMMGLRTSEGVDLEKNNEYFNLNIRELLLPVINVWKNKGYISSDNKNLALNRSGRFFHNSFMIDILRYLEKVKCNFT